MIRKGSTPAGMHISIMVREIIDFLQIKPGQTGFDATLGYGGHTKAMLECLHGEGHMYATDVDPEESAKTKKRLEELGYGEDILSIRLQLLIFFLEFLRVFSFISNAALMLRLIFLFQMHPPIPC